MGEISPENCKARNTEMGLLRGTGGRTRSLRVVCGPRKYLMSTQFFQDATLVTGDHNQITDSMGHQRVHSAVKWRDL